MPKRLSITFWATTFVVVVCLSLVGIDGWRSWNARAQRLADMERVTSNLARSMAQQADDTIKSADTSLTDIVERVETDGYGDAAMRRLHRLMVDQTANLPQLSGLFVYDENGRWMVNSRPGRDSPLNNADREYFLYHQSHTERGPHIGVPVVSRSTGRWIIPVSRRLNHSDGSFGGVALATIDIDYFSRFYQSFDIGEHGAVALFSDDGIMLLRPPSAAACATRRCTATISPAAAATPSSVPARTACCALTAICRCSTIACSSRRRCRRMKCWSSGAATPGCTRWACCCWRCCWACSASAWSTRSTCACKPSANCATPATRWKSSTARWSARPCRMA